MFAERVVRRAVGVAVAAAGVTALCVPTVSASPSDNHDKHDGRKERVIELTLTRTAGHEPPPNPPAGTIYTEFGTSALTSTGQPFGTWGYQGVVLAAEGGETQEQAIGTFNTPEGQITVQGLNPRQTLQNAITGGTKDFSRASGYVKINGMGETVELHIFQR
ncbi:hypothetical protein ACFQ78_39405 [Streptomyces sp. NPDC056519]|uniref:hypothetical protein n=1 Tax=Streptomyces sp. NPDC056519 TaxID=3345849 RepID=UPI0036A4D089